MLTPVDVRRIVGRDDDLAAVAAFLERDGAATALLLEGEPGIGKSTLWRAGVAAATAAGYRVLAARPSGAEAQLSFSSLGDLLEGVPDETFAVLPEPQRRALEVALLLAEPGPMPPDRRAVGLALRAVLDQLARSKPVLIAVDDIQWLDRPSGAALEYALRRLDNDRVGLLASLRRVDGPQQTPPVIGAVSPERVLRLVVEPLALGAIHELVRDRLDVGLPLPLLVRVHETSGGNPFFALELARALRGVTLVAGGPLPLPAALHDAISARLERLSAGAREALLVCSAMTNPTEALVATALDDADEAARGLEEAAAAGVVELADGRIRFEHPLVASTCYSTASGPRRRRLHRTLAKVVDDLEERARHLALAAEGPDKHVALALDQGAELAWSRAAPEAAAELAEQALALTPALDSDCAHTRRLRAARYRFEAGDAARAVTLLEEALAEDADGSDDRRAETLLQLGAVKAQTEGLEAGVELYRRALETAREDSVVSRTHEALARAHADAFQLADAKRHARAAVASAERLDDARLLAQALSTAAWTHQIDGAETVEPLLARAVELEPLSDAVWSPKPARLIQALRLLYTDRVDDARATLEELAAAATAAHAPSAQVFLSYLSLVERRAGRFGAALQQAEAAYALAEQTGRESTKTLALHLKAQALAHLGLADEARTIARDVLVLAAETGQQYRLGLVDQGMLGFLELSLGNSGRAVEYLDPAAELLSDLGIDEPALFTFLPDAIEALIDVGRLERAAELLDRLEEPARRLQRGWALLAAARCRGLLAAQGDGVAAEAAFAESLAIHERLPAPRPFELARTLLARGRVRRRAKHRAAARDDLTRALELFDQLGAALWAERAAAELARIPGRVTGGDELTATERQVAELVALGLSNKEVAAKLYVSVRAVESNLTKIYGKLGIRSRTELARRLHV